MLNYFPYFIILLSGILYIMLYIVKSRDSLVGIAVGYGMDSRGSRVRFLVEAGNFSLHRVQNDSEAQPASYPMGARILFLRVNRPGREAEHSLPSSAEVKD
jgi:hypothetical protein